MRVPRITLAAILVASACRSASEPSLSASSIARRLSVGETTVCALDVDGTVYCWGQNGGQWQYGEDSTTQSTSTTPIRVPIPRLVSINAGVSQHMCGITASQGAVCWGRGQLGELGGMVFKVGNPATVVQGNVSWADITVSRLITCGLDVARTAYCWGSNEAGEIGVDTIPIPGAVTSPIPTAGMFPFAAIAPGWRHGCGIVLGGKVYCWGDNTSGQLGIGTADEAPHLTAEPIAGPDRFVQLSSGSLFTCGITVDHRAMCWGANLTGQLGDGTTTQRNVPTLVAGGLTFSVIAVASGFSGGTAAARPSGPYAVAHACALTDAGPAYCWGWNGAGQIGDGTTTDRLTPTAVAGGLQFTTIGLGGSHTCGMHGSAIWCWGSNLYGQLGNGTGVDSPVPVQVQSPFAKP